jgi:DNA-binding response OmpR family regulator
VACNVHFFFPEICGMTPVRKKVLVVDDSSSELLLIKQFLEQGGYKTVTLGDPTKIEEIIDVEQPSVISLDVVKPGHNGFQVCRELKGQDSYATIRAILVMSKCSTSDKYWNEQQGANKYAVKPFTSGELLRAARKFA